LCRVALIDQSVIFQTEDRMAGHQTENDILKALVRKGALSEICKELNTSILSSPRTEEKAL